MAQTHASRRVRTTSQGLCDTSSTLASPTSASSPTTNAPPSWPLPAYSALGRTASGYRSLELQDHDAADLFGDGRGRRRTRENVVDIVGDVGAQPSKDVGKVGL